MKKPIIVLSILFFIILVLFCARAFASNRISTSGVEFGSIQDQIDTYKTQNIILKEKIYGLSSLTHVSSEAAKMGFVEGQSSFALAKDLPLARK